MKKILLVFLMFLIKNSLFSYEIKYILQHFSQFHSLSDPIKICIDNDDNIIVASTLVGTVDFDLSSSVYNLSPINSTNSNYIAKYSSHGKLLFAINFGSAGGNRVADVVTDSSNNIYILGDFIGTIDLDPGRGTTSFSSYTPATNAGFDIYLSKFSSKGRFIWGKRFGNLDWDYSEDLQVDKKGNIYFTATFRDVLKIDTTTISNKYYNTNYRSPYIVKLNTKGDVKWVRHNFTNNAISYGKNTSLVIDDSLNVYLAGIMWFSVMFNYNISSNNFYSVNNEQSCYIQKIDSVGNFKWAKIFEGKNRASKILFFGIDIDKENNIYLAGEFQGKVDIDPSTDSLFLYSNNNSVDGILIKLKPNGDLILYKTFGKNGLESIRSIDISNNKISLLGDFSKSFYYKINNKDSVIFDAKGFNGVFFMTFDDSFKYEYSNYFTHVGLNFNNSLRFSFAFNILLNKKQNYYLTGSFGTSFNFNLNKDSNNIITPGSQYFVKINNCKNSYDTIFLTKCNNYKSPSNKFLWTKTGIYYDTLENYKECDSIITINLNIYNKTSYTLNVNTCNKSFLSPSKKYIYTKNGLYFDTLINIRGCDSIVKINLNFDSSTYKNIRITSCNEIVSPSLKYIYNSSGIYYDTIFNYKGCDSLLTIFFTKSNSSSSLLNIKSCSFFESPSRKHIWQNSGTYFDTIKNHLKCDSFITINLLIYNHKIDTFDLFFCNSIKSPSKKRTWSTTGIQKDTFLNYFYCDSIVAYNLISNKSYFSTSLNPCRQFILPNGNKVIKSGIYQVSIPNYKGCDSIIEFDLNINQINNQIISENNLLEAIEDSIEYQWYDCIKQELIESQTGKKFTPIKNGKYSVILKKNNCLDTSQCINYNNLSLSDISKDYLKIYPSPANNFLILEIPFDLKPKQINIYNSLSKIMKSIYSSENYCKIELDFDNGMYYIEIIDDTNQKTFGKFVILK